MSTYYTQILYGHTACGGVITDHDGTLTLPVTEAPVRCVWLLTAPQDERIYITVNGTLTADSVIIRSPHASAWTHVTAHQTYGSVGRHLIVELAGNGTTEQVLSVTYSMHNEGCGFVDESTAGVIASPNYPNHYPDGVHCEWVIKAPAGYAIRISTRPFHSNVSPLGNCDKAYLEVCGP